MAILESVKKLAEKLGADTNGRDITDQLNKINKHLDSAGSSNIAEAVSKFADKEDGTAILTTKSITENGTYNASDDNANGYSKVTVNVETSFSRFVFPDQIFWLRNGELCSEPESAIILKANNGEYSISGEEDLPSSPRIICLEPLVSFTSYNFDSPTVIFTPAETYNAFTQATGDTVTPGDGKIYIYTERRVQGTKTYTITKYDTDFVYSIT